MECSVRAAAAALAKVLGKDPLGAALFDSRDMARRMEAHRFALPAALAPGEGEATLQAFRTDYRLLANRRDMRTRGAQREVALELARSELKSTKSIASLRMHFVPITSVVSVVLSLVFI
jgi:hypothetical protein